MPIVRAYDGPGPGHPVLVVPPDPERHGALVRVRGWEVAVADPTGSVASGEELGAAADELGWDRARMPGLPPFTGGLVGFLTDDLSPGLLGLPAQTGRIAPAPLAPLWFGRYDGAACRDPDGVWWLTGTDRAALARADALLREAAARPLEEEPDPPAAPDEAARASMSPDAHRHAVRRILAWIAAGDVYQVNLTLHVGAPWQGSPRTLARALFGASHNAPHAAFLHAPGATIASVSPETFLRTDGRRAVIRPIKGTRRRHPDPACDRALAEGLLAATKDRAEHVMIVDLERNDLGRICEVGSVRVTDLMALEGHPTVWHLTSTLEGMIRRELGLREVLRALFPCGSVTGAPKRMAVSRIAQLEPWQRGVYCGAIGVISEGLVDLSVAIRTAVIHDGMAWYGTGGGIVADSDADAEWDEAMAKAAAFFTATGATVPLTTP